MIHSSASPPHQFAAELLRVGASAYAAGAAERIIDEHSEVALAFAPHSFEGWRGFLSARVLELSAALYVNRPGLAAQQAQWAASAFVSRGIRIDDMRSALRILGEQLVDDMPDEHGELIATMVTAAKTAIAGSVDPMVSGLRGDEPSGRLAAEYLLAVLEGDRRRAGDLVLDAVRNGLDVEAAYVEVLLPAGIEIGRLWHQNELSIAEEHFATAITRTVMAQVLSLAKPPSRHGHRAVVAAAEGNMHDLAVQFVADFLELDGWTTVPLGPSLPATEVAGALDTFDADLLAVSATLTTHLPELARLITCVRRSPRGQSIPIMAGGQGFGGDATLAHELGADAAVFDAREARTVARALVKIGG